MSNWLAKATGIHISPKKAFVDRNQLGNMLKNVSPIAGAFTGGLGGVLLGGAGSALGRGVQKGANFGNVLKQGISGAGISSLGQSAIGGIKGAFGGAGAGGGASSSASASGGMGGGAGGSGVPGILTPEQIRAGGDIASGATSSGASSGFNAMNAAAPKGPQSFLGKVGSFAKHNPEAIGMGLQGVGELSTAGSSNRLANAQADRLYAQTDEDQRREEEERRRDLALEPLRRALAGQLTQPRGPVAPNPYGP